MVIANDGTGDMKRGNYTAKVLSKTGHVTREASVKNHARLSSPVWALIKKLLTEAGY